MLYFIISSCLCFRYFFFVRLDVYIPLFSLCPIGHFVYVSAIFFLSTWTILYFCAKTLINNKNLKKHLRLSMGYWLLSRAFWRLGLLDLVPLDPVILLLLCRYSVCLALDCCLFVYAGIFPKALDG